METAIKDQQHTINKKEHEKTDGKTVVKTEVDELKKALGLLKDNYKKSLGEIKVNIGTELFNRYITLN
jgi:rRNA maturation endonuclease Nob1